MNTAQVISLEFLRKQGRAYELVALALPLVVAAITWQVLKKAHRQKYRLAPGPKPLPIVGNLHLLFGDVLFKKLAKIAVENDWPIMTFKLPTRRNVFVISSPELTREVLVTQGQVFASRDDPTFAEKYMALDDKSNDMGVLFTRFGSTWRTNRKPMSMGQHEHSKIHRGTYIVDLLQVLYKEIEQKQGASTENGENPLEVRTMICRVFLLRIFLVFLFGPGAEKYGEELNSLTDTMFTCLNMSEFSRWLFPVLDPLFNFYYGKILARNSMKTKLKILKKILDDRAKFGGEKEFAFSDILTDAQNKGNITFNGQMHILDEVIFAGTTNEGAMKELASHPEILKKIQDEMDQIVGKRQLRLEDVDNLPYFQAFIRECLRLHHFLSIITPHVNSEDTKLNNYDIPKDSSIWINAWALAHDPEVFPDPFTFKPERFLNWKVGLSGDDTRYVVFGAGRRMCAGFPLDMICCYMIVGSLAQRYHIRYPVDWTSGDKTLIGFLPRNRPLEICFTTREIVDLST